MELEEVKNGLRIKKEGPLHFIFQGSSHVGNVIAPTLGGDKTKAQKYTAISRLWGRKSTHDSKHSALDWLKNRHGETMKIESETMDASTHDLLRDNGWKKNRPSGNTSQIAKYTHSDLPGHHINVSYTNDTWQHHNESRDSNPHVGLGPKSLHGYLNTLHASKTIQGEAIIEFVEYVRDEHPNNWREIIVEFVSQVHLREGGVVYKTKVRDRNRISLPDLSKPPEERIDPKIPPISTSSYIPTGPAQPGIRKPRPMKLGKNTSGLSSRMYKKEGMEQEIQGETPRSLEKKAIHRSKVAIMKTKPYGNIPEEFFDKEKNEKDPKAGPQPKLKGAKPKPSDDAESEVTIKKTMTGEPGPTIEINPKMINQPAGQDTFTAPDNRKRPGGT